MTKHWLALLLNPGEALATHEGSFFAISKADCIADSIDCISKEVDISQGELTKHARKEKLVQSDLSTPSCGTLRRIDKGARQCTRVASIASAKNVRSQ